MRDGAATSVRPGAGIGSGTVDAADAQDSAGLLLFARANQLFLVRRDTRLVDGLARLEPPGGLRAARSGRAAPTGLPSAPAAPRRPLPPLAAVAPASVSPSGPAKVNRGSSSTGGPAG